MIHNDFALLSRRAAVLACAALLCAAATLKPADARSGPFVNFHGNWSGSGIIRVKDDNTSKLSTERMRCSAAYRQSSSSDVNLKLVCKSDSYSLDLTGDFAADAKGHITGDWTEHTRNVGGNVVGQARGSHLVVHAESPVLNANLSMSTYRHSQSVRLKAAGGGQQVSASIHLRRR
ncbi:MAG: hypothetical protein WCA36_21915 [Pseudolabrys sp.]|jgi:hypothetical protein